MHVIQINVAKPLNIIYLSEKMSKHISRLISSSRLLRQCPNSKQPLKTTLRFQTTAEPGKGKGPISWKSLSIVGVIGAGMMGFFYYVKNEKEAGKYRY